MSQNGSDVYKASLPGRPRHQITRSISEISSPIHLHRRHSQLATKEKNRDTHSSASRSAIPIVQDRRSFEVLRSEGVTPKPSPNASRRTSILHVSTDELMPTSAAVSSPAPALAIKDSKDDGLVRQQQKAAAQESGLQRSLAGLENFANVTTKRLDDTYYSLGEKLNALQGTITALKELAESSQKLNETFSAETEALVADINSQLDAFGQFEDQQRRIQSLQNRITLGRESIALLSKRVDGVRERIESWERADKEWQERTRKRLKVVWIVTSVVIFVVVLLYVGAQYTPDSLEATSQIASDGSNTLRGVAEVQADMLWTSKEAPTQWLSMALNGTGKGMVKAPSPEPEALLALDEL
ncbi:hypothetical protein N656DRAFT_780106 [Canariomyces notabilis]|uniref:Uncharacterized protein n=1 Tax=Canariomyces notabilis TaxID=2074819 RepID=A0AAN6YRE4_9PEZI|nr:hypothetical protein N656DRAFT_780106 [Canariomyces arenarius]